MTAIRPSIVNIGKALLSQIPARRFLCNRRGTLCSVDTGFAPTETKCRTQSLRIFAERPAAYRYGSTHIIFYQKMLSATRDIQAFSGCFTCFTIVSQKVFLSTPMLLTAIAIYRIASPFPEISHGFCYPRPIPDGRTGQTAFHTLQPQFFLLRLPAPPLHFRQPQYKAPG